ncbi:hypothetical protein DPMN_176895 [Dreissena polymorpha]|uniref:Uncharacterized protein n=1 Tax=Dreissena polymorpha TaxID=45954 RepID=A0A9D4IK18_DREPO|nr:hypothetical protein DPMN_176895 [Dreissena polymorpha]
MFLDNIMQETLQNHHTSISLGVKPISILGFADEIETMGETSSELQDLTKSRSIRNRGQHGEFEPRPA